MPEKKPVEYSVRAADNGWYAEAYSNLAHAWTFSQWFATEEEANQCIDEREREDEKNA
jgi:hypothetical protein